MRSVDRTGGHDPKPGEHPAERRLQRLEQALAERLAHVRCAVQAVHHRHNMSAILRTCDALGLHPVHLIEGHFRPSKGAARGAERWLDLHHHQTVEEGVAAVKASGCTLWVADLTDDSVPPEAIPLDRPVCLWFGAELLGVDPVALEAADGVVHIPMRGLAQSLNVSVAAALALRAVVERTRELHGRAALLPDEEREAVWREWIGREEKLQEALRQRG